MDAVYDFLKRNVTDGIDNREKIKQIVYEEFSILIKNIEADFKSNFIKKKYNFLLNQLDENLLANMVFVSSFESKSGNAIEKVAQRVARLKFGEENVPPIVNPRGISHSIKPADIKGQIIVSDIDMDNGDLNGIIAKFRQSNVACGGGKTRQESKVTQQSIKSLIPCGQKYRHGDKCFKKPVDLAFYDGAQWNLMELKAGGDLDSSNAPKNIEKLLTEYVGLNVPNANIYFATLYNKDGEGNSWNGAVKRHMNYPSMFLIGKQFWERILPYGISYEVFTDLYRLALVKINLNSKIHDLIKKAIGDENDQGK